MRARRQAVVSVLAACAIVSCRQVIGVPEREPPIACATPARRLPACGTCAAARCCDSLDECSRDDACRALLDCRARCTDATCDAACEGTWHRSEATAALVACERTSCEHECERPCGGAGAPVVGCKECGALCCSDAATFASSIDGERLVACRAACGKDAGCAERCADVHVEGAHLERVVDECIARACAIAGNWSCLGRVDAPPASVPQLTLSVRIIDAFALQALSGFSVRACPVQDLACVNGDPPVVTDSSGRATLTIQLRPGNGLDAYPGFLEVSHAEYVTTLVYFAPALVRDASLSVFVSQQTRLDDFARSQDVQLDPGRGTVIAGATDCVGRNAAGASIHASSSDGVSKIFYFNRASAGAQQLDVDATATSDVGYGGVLGLPAGTTKVTFRIDALCTDLASAEIGVRAGAVSEIVMGPAR